LAGTCIHRQDDTKRKRGRQDERSVMQELETGSQIVLAFPATRPTYQSRPQDRARTSVTPAVQADSAGDA